MQKLKLAMVDHQPPFTLMGSGRTALRHKLQRIAASLRLEFHSHAELAACFADTIVMLKDQGTERGLTRIKPIPVASVLPFFDSGSAKLNQHSHTSIGRMRGESLRVGCDEAER